MHTMWFHAELRSVAARRAARHAFLIGAAAACLAAACAGEASAQFMGYTPPPRRPQLQGNYWSNQQVYNGRTGEYENRRTFNEGNFWGDVGRSLRYEIDSANYRNQFRPAPQTYRPAQPSYQQYQPSYPQRVESAPRIVEEAPRPVANVIPPKPVEIKPAANAAAKETVSKALSLNGTTQTDVMQIIVANQSTDSIQNDIDPVIQGSGNAALIAAWDDAKKDGSPDAMSKFNAKFGPQLAALDKNAATKLDIAVSFEEYRTNVEDGLLSGEGQKAALQKISSKVATLNGADPLRKQLAEDLRNMKELQQVGELIDLSVNEPLPLVDIWPGFLGTDMPIGVLSEIVALPLIAAPVANSEPIPEGETIKIVNPSTNRKSVAFAINGKTVQLTPGSMHGLRSSTVVVFDQGDGTAKQVSVSAGTWAWRIENGTYSLEKITPQITITNAEFPAAFNYMADKVQASLKTGESKTHAGTLPIQVSFDPGNGKPMLTKLLTAGTYAVGIEPSTQGLDLTRTDVPEPDSTSSLAGRRPSATDGNSRASRIRSALSEAERQQKRQKLIESMRSGDKD